MAAGQAGSAYDKVTLVQKEPAEVIRELALAADAVRGCRLVALGPLAILLERRFVPIWAILIIPVGIAMVVLEQLGARAKQVESVAITLSVEEGATRVSATGVANRELAARLDGVLADTPKPA